MNAPPCNDGFAPPQTGNNDALYRLSAMATLAEKLKEHFAGLPHADQPGVLSQADGFAFAVALDCLVEVAIDDIDRAMATLQRH